jgi:hypothetical protein
MSGFFRSPARPDTSCKMEDAGCRTPRPAQQRALWESGSPPDRQPVDSASCGRAVFHNVGTTAATVGGSSGSQHCDRGHPREARRGEGASKLRSCHRSSVAVPGTLWLEWAVHACACNRVPGSGVGVATVLVSPIRKRPPSSIRAGVRATSHQRRPGGRDPASSDQHRASDRAWAGDSVRRGAAYFFFRRVLRFFGARGSLPCARILSSRAASSSTACSSVTASGSVSLGIVALTVPSVT